MWCTKLIGLVALAASILANAGEFKEKEINIRVDAAKEPFETVMNVVADGPTSKLFGNCLNALRKMEVQLFSIEMPGTTDEFVRHVPDNFELTNPPVWEMVKRDPPVSSILDCADAVDKMNKPMFKYNGGDDCKASNRTYDLSYESACAPGQQEPVFLGTKLASACSLPAWMLNINTAASTCTCVHVTTDLMTYAEASSWCDKRGASIFTETKSLQYSAIVQLLLEQVGKSVNVTASNFFTAAENSNTNDLWYWKSSEKSLVNSSLYPAYQYARDEILYMRGDTKFKLDFAPKSSFKAGVVCVFANSNM